MFSDQNTVQALLDKFVISFNEGDFEEACQLYSPGAILQCNNMILKGRRKIAEFYATIGDVKITNCHVDICKPRAIGSHLHIMVEMTTVTKQDEVHTFQRWNSTMMLEKNGHDLFVNSNVALEPVNL